MNQMATGRKIELDRVIATISDAAGGKGDWLLVANSVLQVRSTGAWRDKYKSETDWLNAAAEAYNVTTNTLRRLLSAAQFINQKSASAATPIVDPVCGAGTFGMASVELIKRMNDISPAEADRALADLSKDRLSYREAKRRYDHLISSFQRNADVVIANPPYIGPAKLNARRAHEDRSRLGNLIANHIESLSGIDAKSAQIRRMKFDYVSPDNVVIGKRPSGKTFLDGYEYKKFPPSSSKAALSKLLSDTAFAATFFRRYWLILNAPFQDAEWLATSLADLGIANVGVALHEEAQQDDLNLLRSPSGKPLPDRQERSLKYISG